MNWLHYICIFEFGLGAYIKEMWHWTQDTGEADGVRLTEWLLCLGFLLHLRNTSN
jgi:hypothetical protein